MSQWTNKKRQEFAARRSERMSRVGREFELTVEKYLEEMKAEGLIDNFVRHKPRSPEDYSGRDFTVDKIVDHSTASVSFGITISIRCWHVGQKLHQEYPQLCFPIGTKKETIRNRILRLFENGG